MDEERIQRIHRILSCSEALVHGFNPSRDRAWLRLDLTMPQLKALIYVTKNQNSTSGQIAASLGVGLSTITGIVDRLAEQSLVTRREDPRDRRVTRVLPTPTGAELVDELIQYRNEVVTAILSQLDPDQLQVVESAFQYLLDAAAKLDRERNHAGAVA
ncbi:MAG: MarR family transcriptional regulator [Chloroflexi bacterium]|nr:MarR family transcriptional regulator [Chloroflexota bacterium]MBV9897664.1 MarR family transcriptional regulator [Chloroflexota bacterium]